MDRLQRHIQALLLITCLVNFGSVGELHAQFHLRGSLQSSVYAFDTPEVEQANFYQGVQLRLSHEALPGGYISSYFRLLKPGEADWEERFYHLYADLKGSSNDASLRVGRQFLYHGVINGTLDGVSFSSAPVENMKVRLVAGIETPFNREARIADADSNAFGALVSYKFHPDIQVNASFFQRRRDSRRVWRVAGAALNGSFNQNLYYQFQLEYNMLADRLQGARSRLSYFHDKWILSAEYARQEPRILEDSYFRIFEVNAYNQARGGVTYQFEPVQVGVQYVFTDHYVDQTNQVILTLGNEWGVIGSVYQTGLAGENLGVYGDIRYQLFSNLTVKAQSSFYTFEKQLTDISEDAVSYSGGVEFRPFKTLALSADVQESINPEYDNDLRGLFRLTYRFLK